MTLFREEIRNLWKSISKRYKTGHSRSFASNDSHLENIRRIRKFVPGLLFESVTRNSIRKANPNYEFKLGDVYALYDGLKAWKRKDLTP